MDATDDLLQRVETLPATPKLLPQLLGALADIDTDISRVVELITFDPALTARVVQVCNSASYALNSRVNTVNEAVNHLGFHGIYTIAAIASGESMMNKSEKSAIDPDALWRHLVTSAFAAQHLARFAQADASMLFTAGLLHDIGKMPLADVMYQEYAELVTDTSLFGRTLAELETFSFTVNHAEVGARLLQRWEFAPEFVAAVRWHHQPEAAGEHERIAAALEMADLVAHSLEVEDEQAEAHLLESPAAAILGLDESGVARQRELARGKLEIVNSLCG